MRRVLRCAIIRPCTGSRPEANRRILLTGHMDTVFAADHPFQTLKWLEDGVLNGPEGEPVVELDDKARALLAARGASRLLLSLTHTDTLAQAFVVLVR